MIFENHEEQLSFTHKADVNLFCTRRPISTLTWQWPLFAARKIVLIFWLAIDNISVNRYNSSKGR